MTASSYLQAIDAATLTAPVRQALGSDTARLQDWQVRQLGGGNVNPVSVGLFRFWGTALDGGRRLPWSLVLKIIQSPANAGWTNLGEGDDLGHWNYWKRELLLYRSGLLDALPRGLAAPRCLGQAELPGDVAWLWLEEVSDLYGGDWSLDHYAAAARLLGRLGGCYLGERSLPSLPWLGRNLLRDWLAELHVWAPRFAETPGRLGLWEHPRVLRRYGPPELNPLRRLLLEGERVLAALDELPQTLCHGDAQAANLMWQRAAGGGERLVALDWALAGVAPVGADLAGLMSSAYASLDVERDRLYRSLFQSYLAGLREGGWQGDERLVRFGFAACAALRDGIFALYLLDQATAQDETGAPGPGAEVLPPRQTQALSPPVAYELWTAEEAFRWLESVA